jgi:hypothetical protein
MCVRVVHLGLEALVLPVGACEQILEERLVLEHHVRESERKREREKERARERKRAWLPEHRVSLRPHTLAA